MTSHGWRAIVALVTALVAAASFAFLQASQSPSAPDQLTLRIIVVSSADEAARIAQRLAAGENFIALAAKVSLDASADKGGLLGRVSPSTLRPELRNALQGLGVGQISPVVHIATGFAILKVVADADAGDAPAGTPSPALAATGSVKYGLDVSGMGEALVGMNQSPHPSDWNVDPHALCGMRQQSIAAVQSSLERDVSPASDADPIQSHYLLGQTYAYQGKMDRAIDEFRKAREMALVKAPSTIPTLEETLGIAYLHRAGFENGVYQHPGDLCLLSPTGTRALAKTGDADKAVEYFLRYLAAKPDDLEVKWLLNLAYMSAGGYPGKVPPADLIPPSALASAEDVGHFADVAPQAGLNAFASAGGLIVDDFDNDGRFDVVTSSVNSCEGDALLPPERRRHVHRPGGPGRDQRSDGQPEHPPGRLQQRRLHRHPAAARRVGVPAAEVAAAQQRQRHLHRRDGGERPRDAGDPDARRRSGPTSTTTGFSICSSAPSTARRSSFSTRETAPSSTSPAPPASTARPSPRAWPPADFDNDGWPDLFRLEHRRPELPLPQQPRRHVHRPGESGGGRRGLARLRDLVLRLRQRRLARSLRHQLLHVG